MTDQPGLRASGACTDSLCPGTLVRTRVNEISRMGRNTQGVRLINVGGGETLVGVERILEVENGEGPEEGEV